MAEQNKTQMGDGADNYGQAAGQMAKAAKQLGQKAAKQAAAKGVEATANAATAAVQASVQGGKAAAEIAAGTAAGGPWGAAENFDLHMPLFTFLDYIGRFLADHCHEQHIRSGWFRSRP